MCYFTDVPLLFIDWIIEPGGGGTMNQAQTQQKQNVRTAIPDLIVEAAMVNPAGKSGRIVGRVPNDQLNLEWVQLRNLSDHPILLTGLELHHLVYADKVNGVLGRVMTMQGQLPEQRRLRIHSGHGQPSFDKKRLLYHVYINPEYPNFNYQIIKNDTIALVHPNGSVVDQGHYEVPISEGKRVIRVAPVVDQLLKQKVRDTR
jgi:hypothetical protein